MAKYDKEETGELDTIGGLTNEDVVSDSPGATVLPRMTGVTVDTYLTPNSKLTSVACSASIVTDLTGGQALVLER